MSEFNLSYLTLDNQQESKVIKSSEILFLIGANGKGKSTLIHHFCTQNPGYVRWITAHRQVWFNSNLLEITPAGRMQSETNFMSRDQQADSRWRDDHAAQRSQVTIFDLIDAENVEARGIVEKLRSGNVEQAVALSNSQSPLSKMNDILKISNLDIQIKIDQGNKLLALRGDTPPYSIAELSDGERSALLIIANVLTAPSNTLILLDEPERHLHRSIISPLLSTLLTYREDCAYVISTHEVALPLDQNKAAALLIRSYNHEPKSWVIDYIPAVQELDEQTAETVLGSRRKILFIEGKNSSLDLQIYQILYPNLSIKAVGSCVEIERIVSGLNASEKHHWISAIGIVDRDNREQSECTALIKQGIIPLNHYSVESIYYHPEVISSILKRFANIQMIDIEETISLMNASIIDAFRPHIDRMAARLVERAARDQLLRQAPNWKLIMEGNCEIIYSTKELFEEEKKYLLTLIEKKDIMSLISRYPIRETPVLECVSKAVGLLSQEKYEQAVRKMLSDSIEEKNKVLNLLKPVTDYLEQMSS